MTNVWIVLIVLLLLAGYCVRRIDDLDTRLKLYEHNIVVIP